MSDITPVLLCILRRHFLPAERKYQISNLVVSSTQISPKSLQMSLQLDLEFGFFFGPHA